MCEIYFSRLSTSSEYPRNERVMAVDWNDGRLLANGIYAFEPVAFMSYSTILLYTVFLAIYSILI